MAHNFLQALHAGRVLLMDGGMGTELQRVVASPGACNEKCNLDDPHRVLCIHRGYAEAGAEVLVTNTFQANPAALRKNRLDMQLELICAEGIRLARQASGGHCFVLGDIGPQEGSRDDLARIVAALAGADGLLLETCSDLVPLQHVARLRCDQPDLRMQPVLFSCTYLRNSGGNLRTFAGMSPEAVAQEADQLGADALGVNCGREIDMEEVMEISRRYRNVTNLPLFARPNAGTPTELDGRWTYPRSPEQMAAKLPELLEAGAAMVGGCCGTKPSHIAAFKCVIDSWNART